MNSWIKYIYPVLGLLGLFGTFWYSHYVFWPVSSFDFEGFNPRNLMTIYLSLYFLFMGIYYFNKGGFLSTKSRAYKAPFSMLLLHIVTVIVAITSSIYPLVDRTSQIKYKLPLKKIQTTEITGILQTDFKLSKDDQTEYNIGLTALKLEEFHNIIFSFPYEDRLKTEITNYSDESNLQQGEQVKLKIRTAVYKEMLEFVENGANMKVVTFYELASDDHVIVKKFGLE